MTRKLKRPIAFVSAFAMMLTTLLYVPDSEMPDFGFGITASAEETCTHKDSTVYTLGDYLYHSLSDEGCVYMHQYFGSDTSITIPNMIVSRPVYGIESDIFNVSGQVESVFLPDTIGSIEDGAFNENQTVWLKFPQNLNHMTSSYSDSYIERNQQFTATFTADEGYTLPSNITILRYTTPLVQGQDYTYSSSTGELTIFADSVDIPLSISASAQKIESATIKFADYYATTDPLNPVILATADVAADGKVSIPVSTIETDANYTYAYYWQYVEQDGNIVVSEEVEIDEYEDVDEEFNDITVKEFVKADANPGMEYFVYVVKTGRLGSINYYVDGAYANITLNLSPTRYNYGKDITYATVPEKPGYEFDGWYFNEDFSGEKFKTQSLAEYAGKYDQYYILKVYGRYVQSSHTHDLEHIFKSEPTCNEYGYKEHYRCKTCDMLFSDLNAENTVTAEEIRINMVAHSFTHYYYNDDATCEENGTETADCDYGCGESDTRTKEGSALGHSLSYFYNNDATCTEDGTETAECENGCGLTDTRTAENTMLDHSFTHYIYNDDATCTEDGTETAYCDYGCGATDIRDSAGSALGHSFTNYIDDQNATCTANGTETAYCDYGCGATDIREIDYVLEHSLNPIPEKSATCTEDGNIAHFKCSSCGKLFSDKNGENELLLKDVTLPASGHSFTDYVYNDDATCIADGTETAICKNRCGITHTRIKEGSALGHSFKEYVYNDNATCTEDGTETAECDYGCGETDTRTKEDSALGHSSSDKWECDDDNHWKICTRPGCSEILDKARHEYGEGVITTPATEEDEGVKTYTCVICNHKKTEAIDKLPSTKLNAPVITDISAVEKSVTLKWEKVEGATSYTVYRSDSETGEKIKLDSTEDTSYTDNSITASGTYYYFVAAVNSTTDAISDYSQGKSIKVVLSTISAPAITDTVMGSGGLYVYWNKVPDATSYRIFRADTPTGKKTQLAVTGSLYYLDSTVTPGKTYYYFLKAYNNKNSALSEYSSARRAAASIVSAPGLTDSVVGEAGLYLYWNSIPGATSYRVYRADSPTGTKTQLTVTGSISFLDKNAEAGRTYYYYVTAFNSSTNIRSAFSTARKVTVVKTASPSLTDTCIGNAGLYLYWNSVPNATSYRIYRADSPTSAKKQILVTASLSGIDKTAEAGKTYYYYVAAFNNQTMVRSAYSSYRKVIMTKISAPIIRTAVVGDSGVSLTWSTSTGATSYRVYRADSLTGAKTQLTVQAGTSFTDTTAESGKTYYYYVVAFNNKTMIRSAMSGYKSVTVE